MAGSPCKPSPLRVTAGAPIAEVGWGGCPRLQGGHHGKTMSMWIHAVVECSSVPELSLLWDAASCPRHQDIPQADQS
jgi:hypothetical protein